MAAEIADNFNLNNCYKIGMVPLIYNAVDPFNDFLVTLIPGQSI